MPSTLPSDMPKLVIFSENSRLVDGRTQCRVPLVPSLIGHNAGVDWLPGSVPDRCRVDMVCSVNSLSPAHDYYDFSNMTKNAKNKKRPAGSPARQKENLRVVLHGGIFGITSMRRTRDKRKFTTGAAEPDTPE